MLGDRKKPNQVEAILVMDSRTTSIAVRSHNAGAWNKLYKMDEYYLDLSLKPDGERALLLGKLVNPNPHATGSVSLISPEGEPAGQAPLNDTGIFRLLVERSGTYQLQMRLGEQQFVVRSLDVS